MKILVGVKRVVDAYVRVRVKSDESGVETLLCFLGQHLPWICLYNSMICLIILFSPKLGNNFALAL